MISILGLFKVRFEHKSWRIMEEIFRNEKRRMAALKKRLEESELGENLRINYARILNRHFKKNGYGHSLFKSVNVIAENQEGESDGKPK